jgi:predicted N-acetyltransferase YhbS
VGEVSLSAPEPLEARHDVSAFDCGKPALNVWLHKHALANQASRASRTFVVCRGPKVVGYYALAAGSVLHREVPGKIRRDMPEPIPMALLGRLAVELSERGSGLGAELLQDALTRIVRAADILSVKGILVDAIDDDARAFYEHFGFVKSPVSPLKLMVPLDEILKRLALPGP